MQRLRPLWCALIGLLVAGQIAQASVDPVAGDYVSRPDSQARVSFTLREIPGHKHGLVVKLVVHSFPDYRIPHGVIHEEIRFGGTAFDGRRFGGHATLHGVGYSIIGEWKHDGHVSGALSFFSEHPTLQHFYSFTAHLEHRNQ